MGASGGQYLGFVTLGEALTGSLLAKDASDTPADAASAPTFRAYGPNGVMTNGTGTTSLKDSGSVTNATNASPIVVTSAGHGLSTGTRVTVSGVLGNTNANTTTTVTVIDANTFSLDGTTGNSSYTGGGSWHVSGLYAFSLTCDGASGYQSGETYQVLFSYTVGGVGKGQLMSFTVV